MTSFNRMQTVKRRFFAMRNGIVADTYRRAGSPFRIVFGLNLPQITEIAREFGHDRELAAELWANKTTRESMLIAPMLLSGEDLSDDTVAKMIDETFDREVADVLVHRVLRHREDAVVIAGRLLDEESPMKRYIALRIAYARLSDAPAEVKSMAEREIARNEPITIATARMLKEDADFVLDEQ